MHARTASLLKNRDDFIMDGIRTQELASTIQTIGLVITRTKPVELLHKEEVCCNRATD